MDEKKHKDCPESSSTLILYLYGEAPDPAGFEAHLATCDRCSELLAQHRAALEKYRDFPPGADYVDLAKAMESIQTESLFDKLGGFLQPGRIFRFVTVFAVAAIFIAAFFMPFEPVTAPERYDLTNRIEEPLDLAETTLEEISADNAEYANGEENGTGPLDELDGMVAELEDIEKNLATF